MDETTREQSWGLVGGEITSVEDVNGWVVITVKTSEGSCRELCIKKVNHER